MVRALFCLITLSTTLSAADLAIPRLADFEAGRLESLGGSIQTVNTTAQLGPASPFSRGNAGLELQGTAVTGQVSRLSLPLMQVAPLDLLLDSPGRALSLDYRTVGNADPRAQLCLQPADGSPAPCVALPATQDRWTQLNIWLPGTEGSPRFGAVDAPHLRAQAMELRVQGPAEGGAYRIQVDELRLDPPASPLAVSAVAQAFSVSEAQVQAVRALGLPETLDWTLLLIQRACACPLQTILDERATRGWGEVAAAHGLDWAALNQDLEQRAQNAGLRAPEASQAQIERALDNQAFAGGRP